MAAFQYIARSSQKRESTDSNVKFCPNDGATLVDPAEAAASGQPLICPTCRRGYGPGTTHCPTDSEELIPYALYVARTKAAARHEGGRICPQCGARYGKNVTFCGKDGAELVLVN